MSDNNENLSSVNTDTDYWSSFKELYADKAALNELSNAEQAKSLDDSSANGLSGMSRRKFFALIGASAALAGVGCSDYRDKGELRPYNAKPEGLVIGKANIYASTCDSCGNNCGILIKTREGRPVKVTGNPDNPVNAGKICAKGEANVLNLYDPERIREPKISNGVYYSEADWKKTDKEIRSLLDSALAAGKEIALVTHKITSPAVKKLLDDFKTKYPVLKVYSYELFNEKARVDAWNKCYGGDLPVIKWDKASVILSLEGDFLGVEGNKLETSRLFSQNRDVFNPKNYSRLYCVEGDMSLTGMNADYRLKLRPDLQYDFIMSLLNEVVINRKISNPAAASISNSRLVNFNLKNFSSKNGFNYVTVEKLVNDLIENRGKSIAYAGRSLGPEVHIAVNLLNHVLGNEKIFDLENYHSEVMPVSDYSDFKALASNMKNNKTGVVIHYDSNPVFHLPKELDYENGLKKAGAVISLSALETETTAVSKYVLPINHGFESWGDFKTRTGFAGLQQPVIAPLYNTRQKEAIILNWISANTDNYNDKLYHDFLMNFWEKEVFPSCVTTLDFKDFWYASLHDGVAFTKEKPNNLISFNQQALNELPANLKNAGGIAVILKESYALSDGRFANNGWLQELPHPVSKITWDNYAAISEKTARELNINENEKIEININGKKAVLPVLFQPGMAEYTIKAESGYGREKCGVVGIGVGHNINGLFGWEGNTTHYVLNGAQVNKTGERYNLISPQEKYVFSDETTKDQHLKRGIIREGAVKEFLSKPGFLKEEKEETSESIYAAHEYKGVKWGMSIDLNRCTGCGDCTSACNVENNIPVVGKDQVEKGRLMQWMRVDRYYSGSAEEPVISKQPMLCQHCDKAPCEQVCPVVATTHSPDGLNQMVYNRCVGTRYCSNNCPYKVRRFNFFNFRDHFRSGIYEKPVMALIHNPEVTVRSRGVMEKCTFCIQRIMEAREDAIREKRELKGSDVKTACQESCGTNAIQFGNINGKDSDSEFLKYRNHELGYYVLEELNVKPNVTYIAKLRNIESEEN
jgi:molybdopterin-containing oxidoreductase family iron-sulfur binding subunit